MYSLNRATPPKYTAGTRSRILPSWGERKPGAMGQLLRAVIGQEIQEFPLQKKSATMLALLALFVLGGDVIRGFVFAMMWGVLIGTYSSIFVASAILLVLGVKRDWSKKDPSAGTKYGHIDT